MRRTVLTLLVVCLGLFVGAGGAQAAGPFGSWLELTGNATSGAAGHGYVEIPHHASLNPTTGFTFEAWIRIDASFPTCRSIAGKGWTEAWWVGVCGNTLRSYLRGSTSRYDAGTIPLGTWTHIAVVGDGTSVKHYIDGVLAGTRAEPSGPTTSTLPMRIGSDAQYFYSPDGAIDEVRLWSVARTAAQINAARNSPITTAQPGLVAVWALDGNGEDVVGSRDGSLFGSFSFDTKPAPPAGPWLSSASIPGFQFKVRITSGSNVFAGVGESDCIAETVCASGALAGRSEVFLRVIGPRPNGYLWPTIVRFTVSQVEVWIEQLGTGQINYYKLDAVPADSDELNGLVDRTGFLP
jgi:hypothetical protein